MRTLLTTPRRAASLGLMLLPMLAPGAVAGQEGTPPSPAAPASPPSSAAVRALPVPALPFAQGERITYRATVAKVGRVGRGSMWVEGPADVRGTAAYVLRFDFRSRVGPVGVVNTSESWLDPVRMASLRFHKHERHPLSKHDERVELYPERRRWVAESGDSAESPTDAPLDELSFMYFIRTLRLPDDTTYRFERHFDAARNPTTVRVVRRETVSTPCGEFWTVLVEMRVRDGRRYRGEGVIRINFTDDAARLPVRIQTTVPVFGAAVLTMESHKVPTSAVVAHAP